MTFNGVTEDPWRAATLTAPYTAGSPVPEYRIDNAGNVHMRGQIVRNAAASGATVFTLPEMYWPTALLRIRVVVSPGSATGRINVGTSGIVAPLEDAGAVTDYFLDNCVFSTY